MEIETIDTEKLSRSPFEIKVIKVFSPTLIWVHLKNSEELFQRMMEAFNRQMSRRRSANLSAKIDDAVAIETKRGWQRGLVFKFNDDGTAQIILRDWGVYVRHSIFDLYHLEDRFREVHWQAVPVALAYTGSATAGRAWPRRAINIARSIAEQQIGFMQIVRPLSNGTAFVRLDIKNETNAVFHNLRDLLIDLGVAQKIATVTTNMTPTIL